MADAVRNLQSKLNQDEVFAPPPKHQAGRTLLIPSIAAIACISVWFITKQSSAVGRYDDDPLFQRF